MGYPDGTVRPNSDITRGETVGILANLWLSNVVTTTDNISFIDVSSTNFYYDALNKMVSLGLVAGHDEEHFDGSDPITRAEFVVMLLRMLDLSEDVPYTEENIFEVPSDYWANYAINYAYDMGYVVGYPDGTFRPDTDITRAEAISIINRITDREPDKDIIEDLEMVYTDLDTTHWAYDEIMEATIPHDYEDILGQEIWTNVE